MTTTEFNEIVQDLVKAERAVTVAIYSVNSSTEDLASKQADRVLAENAYYFALVRLGLES